MVSKVSLLSTGLHLPTVWRLSIDLVIYVYTNKQMIAESGNYEAFVEVLYCQLYLIQPPIITNKQKKEDQGRQNFT